MATLWNWIKPKPKNWTFSCGDPILEIKPKNNPSTTMTTPLSSDLLMWPWSKNTYLPLFLTNVGYGVLTEWTIGRQRNFKPNYKYVYYNYPLILYREDVAEYYTSARGLVLRLLEAISESLGLERDCIEKALGKQVQHMALDYYPPCPQPELTYGLPSHTDSNLITILLQDDVPGLLVLINGKWIAVNHIPNTFIVNIGDQMQVQFRPLPVWLNLFSSWKGIYNFLK